MTPGTAPPELPPLPPRRGYRLWLAVRENVEAVVIAIILALVIRHFSLEAFEIPTGSMAPGLHGVHVNTVCPNCETIEHVGIDVDSHSGKVKPGLFDQRDYFDGPCPRCGVPIQAVLKADRTTVRCLQCDEAVRVPPEGIEHGAIASLHPTCPECGLAYEELYRPKDCLSGHKILVNKFIYRMREPERWEVIVFKFNRQRNYIKRLIGLPGESIQIQGGDIHIDGRLERKPYHVQQNLWFPVHDSARRERWLAGRPPAPAWEEHLGWKRRESGGYEFDAAEGQRALLLYGRDILNRYPYNARAAQSDDTEPVRDLRIRARVKVAPRPAGAAAPAREELVLLVRNDVSHGIEYRLTLPLARSGTGPARFSRSGRGGTGERVLHELPGLALHDDKETLIDYYFADGQLVLGLDGVLIKELPLAGADLAPYGKQAEKSTVGIEARGIAGVVERVEVFRDIHYVARHTHAVARPFQLAEDQFFALGDNSPSSLDSRAWGFLDRQNLLGRAFCIFWPALPWRWEVRMIR